VREGYSPWLGLVLGLALTGLVAAILAGADEAFLSSSVAGILPVTRFEGRPIGGGEPGPWTRRARADREEMIASAAPASRGRAR
jgi:hypothetical protein